MLRSICVLASLSMLGSVHAEDVWKALIAPSGRVSLSLGNRKVTDISPGLYEQGWVGRIMADSLTGRGGTINTSKGKVTCRIDTRKIANGLEIHYRLTPSRTVSLHSLHTALNIPMYLMTGQSYKVDGKKGVVPVTLGDQIHLHIGQAKSIELMAKNGAPLLLRLSSPTGVMLQDNRKWSDVLNIRIGQLNGNSKPWPGGKTLEMKMQITSPKPIDVDIDGPVTITAGKDWIPLKLDLDIEAGSALDFSKMGQLDAPAGKYGYPIVRKDGQMAFEKDQKTARRFYGVNFCFSAHYLTHEQSDRVADRLARLGYNTVRFHHYEGELVDKSKGTTTTFRKDKLDQLDYLFAALKKRGIYVTTDIYVSRPVFAREVFPDASPSEKMGYDLKMLAAVNEKAFENWKLFGRNFMTHVNPYTGLSYAQDPAMAWIAMINEGNFPNYIGGLKGRTLTEWKRAWNKWLSKKYKSRAALRAAWKKDPKGDPQAGSVPLYQSVYSDTPEARDLLAMCGELEDKMFKRMKAFFRNELKCKALLTNQNGWANQLSQHVARSSYDYVDDHFYVDHPQFLGRSWGLPSRCPNTSPIAGGASGGQGNAFIRVFGKPFTISEYNYSAPGRFRGVGGILTGALGAIQDWAVIWRFAYSHSREGVIRPRAMDYFNTSGDPLNQAAERASICLYLRGDMKPAKHSVAIAMTRDDLLKGCKKSIGIAPNWKHLAWVSKVGTYVSDKAEPVPADLTIPLGWTAEGKRVTGKEVLSLDPYANTTGDAVLQNMRAKGWLEGNRTDIKNQILESETKEILIDAPQDMMVLNTAKTQGGYAPKGKTIATDDVEITIADTDATVWVSSVDNKDIKESKRMIVSHLTDLQNSGTRYGEKAKQTLLAWGKLPHLVRAGSAKVRIRFADAAKAKVYALSTSGRRLETISTTVKNDFLTIPISVQGRDGARLVYEVVSE